MSDFKIKHYAERFAKSQKKSMVQLLLIHNSYLQTGENFKSFLLLFERVREGEGRRGLHLSLYKLTAVEMR